MAHLLKFLNPSWFIFAKNGFQYGYFPKAKLKKKTENNITDNSSNLTDQTAKL